MNAKLTTLVAMVAFSSPALAEDEAPSPPPPTPDVSSSGAQHNEVSLELGTLHANDAQWRMFSDPDSLGTWGVRAGWALDDTWSIVGSWHRGARGGTLTWYSSGDYDTTEIALAIKAMQLAVGPKATWDMADWLRPYATLQAMGMTGRMMMDDDTYDTKNSNQLSVRGWTGGGVVALGFDFVPVNPTAAWGLGSHLELGYGYLLPMTLTDPNAVADGGDIGDLRFRGFYLRWGGC